MARRNIDCVLHALAPEGWPMTTELELILALFFVVIVASSLHPALRVVLGTLIGVLMLIIAIVFRDDEARR
jgi:hypothetical protein